MVPMPENSVQFLRRLGFEVEPERIIGLARVGDQRDLTMNQVTDIAIRKGWRGGTANPAPVPPHDYPYKSKEKDNG